MGNTTLTVVNSLATPVQVLSPEEKVFFEVPPGETVTKSVETANGQIFIRSGTQTLPFTPSGPACTVTVIPVCSERGIRFKLCAICTSLASTLPPVRTTDPSEQIVTRISVASAADQPFPNKNCERSCKNRRKKC